jgi:hypothetical protein
MVIASSSEARLDSFSIVHTQTNFCGHLRCVEIEGRMKGQAPGGPYDVPVSMMFPENPLQRNGTAIVDVANSIAGDVTFFDTSESNPQYLPTLPVARALLGDAFLGDYGFIYFEVNWDKLALFICNLLGRPECGGELALGTDGYFVIKDASDFLKNPSAELHSRYGLSPAKASIAFGYSQSAYLLQRMYKREQLDLSFDGVLLGVADFTCTTLLDDFPWWTFENGCEAPMPPSAGKVILLNSESDVQTGSFLMRGDTDSFKAYEMAGVSHLPKPLFDLAGFGATRQNPADSSPVFRAMVENLRRWIMESQPPPPSVYLEPTADALEDCPLVNLAPALGELVPLCEVKRETYCATGGIRLPNCPNPSGGGSPLGVYAGIETDFHPAPDFLFRSLILPVGGTFDPLSKEDLKRLYPRPGSYLTGVLKSVITAWRNRWILGEDAVDYLRAATRCPVGKKDFNPASPEELRATLEECQRL